MLFQGILFGVVECPLWWFLCLAWGYEFREDNIIKVKLPHHHVRSPRCPHGSTGPVDSLIAKGNWDLKASNIQKVKSEKQSSAAQSSQSDGRNSRPVIRAFSEGEREITSRLRLGKWGKWERSPDRKDRVWIKNPEMFHLLSQGLSERV